MCKVIHLYKLVFILYQHPFIKGLSGSTYVGVMIVHHKMDRKRRVRNKRYRNFEIPNFW